MTTTDTAAIDGAPYTTTALDSAATAAWVSAAVAVALDEAAAIARATAVAAVVSARGE